jgi:16S rRNA (adenine1518-N6/adenine1519-N6)-dimethyltransferase
VKRKIKLSNPYKDRILTQLKEFGVIATKERGQNFLIDPYVTSSILELANPRPSDHILEIGAGLGALTNELQSFAKLTIVEIEERFCDYLEKSFPSAQVIEGDFLNLDLSEFPEKVTIFGNLPYSASSSIILHLIKSAKYIKSATLMLQREFVERLTAKPASRSYGRLSIISQLWSDHVEGRVVAGDSFFPATEVESKLVKLIFLENPRYQLKDHFIFELLVQAAFKKRRQKIINSFKATNLFDESRILSALNQANIDSGARAEELEVEDYVRLANLI